MSALCATLRGPALVAGGGRGEGRGGPKDGRSGAYICARFGKEEEEEEEADDVVAGTMALAAIRRPVQRPRSGATHVLTYVTGGLIWKNIKQS
jgi:hypothetical protein